MGVPFPKKKVENIGREYLTLTSSPHLCMYTRMCPIYAHTCKHLHTHIYTNTHKFKCFFLWVLFLIWYSEIKKSNNLPIFLSLLLGEHAIIFNGVDLCQTYRASILFTINWILGSLHFSLSLTFFTVHENYLCWRVLVKWVNL